MLLEQNLFCVSASILRWRKDPESEEKNPFGGVTKQGTLEVTSNELTRNRVQGKKVRVKNFKIFKKCLQSIKPDKN